MDKYFIQIAIILLFITYLNSTNTEKQTILISSLILIGFFYFINNNKETFSTNPVFSNTNNTCQSSYATYKNLENNNIFEKAKQNWDTYRKKNQRIYNRNAGRFSNNINEYLKQKHRGSLPNESLHGEELKCPGIDKKCSNKDEIEKKLDELKYMLNNTCF